MHKYEIMLLINGSMDEKDADKVVNDLVKNLQVQKIKMTKHGLKDMAYEIKKQKRAYYYQLNFDSDSIEGLNEFRRLARINKSVLRHLIINLEKDYGYRAANNPKKVEHNGKKAEAFARRQEENARAIERERAERAERLAERMEAEKAEKAEKAERE